MKILQWMALCVLSTMLTIWLSSCSSSPPQLVNLNFAGAGIARAALQEIESIYEREHPNVVLDSIFAGSGVVRKAIERGEPFDGVFFAEIPPIDDLQAKGLIIPETRHEFVSTDIVLVAPVDSTLQIRDFRELADPRIKGVAIGSENLAIGKYTLGLLAKLGIAQTVETKAVKYKSDVREILLAIEKGDVDLGITVLSEAKVSSKVKVLATAPQESYEPIRTIAAVVKASKHSEEMLKYLKFLESKQAMAVFEKFGMHPL